jgi:hypothetical protein
MTKNMKDIKIRKCDSFISPPHNINESEVFNINNLFLSLVIATPYQVVAEYVLNVLFKYDVIFG